MMITGGERAQASALAAAVATACAVATAVLLLDVPLFVFAHVTTVMVPWHWLALPFALAACVAMPTIVREPRLLVVGVAVLVYLAVNALAVATSPDSAASEQELVGRVLGMCVLVSVAVLTACARNVPRTALWVSLAALVAAFLIVYDLVTGTRWSTTLGRAAGTYSNPNVAAAMILFLGMTGLRGVRSRSRELFWCAVGGASVLAFSRAGYLLFGLVTLNLMRTARVRWHRTLAVVLGAAVLGATLGPLLLRQLVARGGSASLVEQIGVSTLLRVGEGDASSTTERLQVAAAAIRLFSEHPLFGAGLTATTRWELPASTHNQFLRIAAELGIVGVAALLVLLTAVFFASRCWGDAGAMDFALWLSVVLLFSHNVLDNWAMLAAIGFFAGGGMRGRSPDISRASVLE